MTAHTIPEIAIYTGGARLWQDANVIEAPSIQFDRDRRFVTAQGTPAHQPSKQSWSRKKSRRTDPRKPPAKTSKRPRPQARSSSRVHYGYQANLRRFRATTHYEGGVIAQGAEFTAAAKTVDAYLLAHNQTSTNQSFAGAGTARPHGR